MYRAEVRLRTRILGEPAKHIRPLSEAKAVENGANTLAEGFLFSVAAALIVGETWRSSRSQSKRRDNVDDQLDDLVTRLAEIGEKVERFAEQWEKRLAEVTERNDELVRIVERVVETGLHSGTGLPLVRVQLAPQRKLSSTESDSNTPSDTKSI